MRVETIGNATLYLGDCRDILPTLPKVDAVITDPPYGILGANHSVSTREWDTSWDGVVDISPLFQLCETVILWGAQHLRHQLPYGGTWLVWDKRVLEQCDAMIGSPFECGIAYPKRGQERIYRIMHGGAVSADNEPRQHPTQKPTQLMRRVMDDWNVSGAVCDPFMGSGTTGVACAQLGRKFIGIEREPKYFDIACERIARAQAQGTLLPPEPPRECVQAGLL